MTSSEFYQLRDLRSRAYLNGDFEPLPVSVTWGSDAAGSYSGQVLIFALVNQLARFCRRASFIGPDAPRKAPSISGSPSLKSTVLGIARSIDPYGDWHDQVMDDACLRIGIGAEVESADIFAGISGWQVSLAESASGLRAFDNGGVMGAAFASCIVSSIALKHSLEIDRSLPFGEYSLWSMTGGGDEPDLRADKLVLGNLLMIGGGAVGTSCAYWLKTCQIQSHVDVVDADVVDVPNTNRGLLFTARDAGLGDSAPRAKVDVIAAWLGDARAYRCWYDELRLQSRADVYLVLANDRNVRSVIQHAYPPLIIHATTGSDWQVFGHRHRPERDQCLACRFPADLPVLECSVGEIGPVGDKSSRDAALPFMSAAAGLLVIADLIRLAYNRLDETNLTILNWKQTLISERFTAHCEPSCRRWGTPAVRRELNTNTKWYNHHSSITA